MWYKQEQTPQDFIHADAIGHHRRYTMAAFADLMDSHVAPYSGDGFVHPDAIKNASKQGNSERFAQLTSDYYKKPWRNKELMMDQLRQLRGFPQQKNNDYAAQAAMKISEALGHHKDFERLQADEVDNPYKIIYSGLNPHDQAVLPPHGAPLAIYSVLNNWKGNFNDDSGNVALNLAANDQFHIENPLMNHFDSDTLDAGKKVYDKYGELLRAILQTQYDQTQDLLKRAGIDQVPIYRGMAVRPQYLKYLSRDLHRMYGTQGPKPNNYQVHPDHPIRFQPISSGTVHLPTAIWFAENDVPGAVNMMTRTKLPRERILSTPLTGLGEYTEHEMSFLGAPADKADVISHLPPYSRLLPGQYSDIMDEIDNPGVSNNVVPYSTSYR